MKVLICHNSYKKISGEDLVIGTDIQILKDHGINVRLYTRSNRDTDSFSLSQKVAFFPNSIYSLRSAREIRQICNEYRPDIAIVQNVFPLMSPSVYHALHKARIPIVQLVYNYRLVCPNAILFTEGKVCERCIRGSYFNAVVHKCFHESRTMSALYATSLTVHRRIANIGKLISAYVTPDQFLQKKLSEGGLPRERMFAILNPFDVTKYTPSYDDKGYFVYFGRIVREKGIFTLLETMRELRNTKLIVVGGGEDEQEARTTAEREGLTGVSFTGPKYGGELIDILRGAIAVVVPTEWYDNSPLVVHQAFAMAKPVIASDIDGIPEIVEHERDGLLFPPGDSAALAEKMRLLWENQSFREHLGRNARAKAEREFTAERRFVELMRVFEFVQNNPI